MCLFSHQIRFTSAALRALLEDGVDPFGAIRARIESLGGALISAYFAADSYEVLALSELPQGVSSNDIAIAFYAGGTVANIRSSVLLTATQAFEACHAGNPYPLFAEC